VGKTISACKIIEKLAKEHAPVGIKISAHFHELANPEYVHRSEVFEIVEEKSRSNKDSSRMLQAGAEKVFYIQSENRMLANAFKIVLKEIGSGKPVVIESGGLYDFVEPGILIHIFGNNGKKTTEHRSESDVVKISSDEVKNFNWDFLKFKNGKFVLNA